MRFHRTISLSKVSSGYRNLENKIYKLKRSIVKKKRNNRIDHFTVVCLVAWPLNESEAGVDLVLIETARNCKMVY